MHLKIHNLVDDQIYYLILTKSLAVGIKQLLLLITASGIGFLIAVFLTVIVGSSSLKKMLKPIDNMISTARSVSAKDLQARLNVVDSHDELKELAETFNEMLDRIQLSYEQQNQFVSDASHELRTPISVIQGYANLLQRWGKEDREVLDEAVNAIKNESENMKSLVEKLLLLARTDRDGQQLEKSTFSLNELIEEVLKETKLIDTEHQIISETAANKAPVTLIADRSLIKQALRIFIDNSIKHTLPGGTIRINGYLSDNRVKLTVEDNGIGIAKEDLPFIFNRFYKCDKSRTREAGGTGLGLSIAKWIIEKHQGHIKVESTLNKGTQIIISLPAC